MRKRKVKNFRKYVLIALVALIVGGVGMLSWGKWDTQYPSVINSPKIPYKYLSNEDIEPYLSYGKVPVLKEGKELTADSYVFIAREIRDVRQCLVRSEQEKPEPDLRLIDWGRLAFYTHSSWHELNLYSNRYKAIDVCIFRIFSSIGTIDGVVRWMQYHRMKTETYGYEEEHSPWPFGSDMEGVPLRTVHGEYDSEKNGLLVPRGFIYDFLSSIPLIRALSEGVYSHWDKNNQLMNVYYYITIG